MKEILITSSALILALLALRRAFRRTLSRRAQYALWGLVLLRLLVPVNLPAAGFSLLTAAKPAADRVEALYITPDRMTIGRMDGGYVRGVPDTPKAAVGPATPDNSRTFLDRDGQGNEVKITENYKRQILLSDLLPPIWYGGMAVMSCWLVLSNLLFWRKLRGARTPYPVEGSSLPVYLVEYGLPSPCLFGLLRPAVYLTPAALQSPDSLRHVLAHEETHARHLDPLWSLLRAVCLTVYWFDPLVWWAALASRTDCELACDEGALRRLGEAERVPYGRTLLSLIPVRRVPANPLLSATTMTADKRQLKDRVTRVAENPVYLGRALFAAVALAALVCAVTFTGAKKPDHFRDVDQAVAALAEELGDDSADFGERLMVYTPENPSEFFDLEKGELLRVYWGSVYLLSSNLEKPMGWLCSLYRLESDYMPENMEILGGDGQYQYGLIHPDQAPEMKRGETTGMSLMSTVTDRIREAVLSCESLKQVAPPDWDAAVTIPLDGLEPYEPQEAEELPFPYGSPNMLGGLEDPDHVLGDYGLMFFAGGNPDMGGEVFAGVQHLARSSFPTPFWSFRPSAGGRYSASLFRGLLGHDGFCISHDSNRPSGTRIHEYYYLNEEGRPVFLAQETGYPQRADLDGDGTDELFSGDFSSFVFYRDGKLYRANLRPLLWTVWPVGTDFRFDGWDPATRSMSFRAREPHTLSYQYRTLSFDGENLLICGDQRHFTDDIAQWPDDDFVIKDAALTAVEEQFHASRMSGSALAFYDDWRITSLGANFDGLEVDGKRYAFRQVSYEFHTPELGESPQDHWAAPSSENLYLMFQIPSQGSQDMISLSDFVYLCHFQQEGRLTLSEELVREKLQEMPSSDIIYLGTATLKAESPVLPAADLVQAAMDHLMEADSVNLNLLVPEGGGRYDVDPQDGNGPNRAHGLVSDFDWSYAEDPGDMPAESLLLMSPGGDLSLRFWPESGLVLLNARQSAHQESVWLRAEPNGNPEWVTTIGVFDFIRLWYDEAELAGLYSTVRVTGRDLTRERIVQLWADAYEGAMLEATPGSRYACTYVRNQNIWFPDWLDELTEEELESFYPENTKGHERFAFAYSTVFVPENDEALHWLMAGNTGPYEGGDAPEGAQIYSHCGYMYLTDEGWRCDGVGTGW